MDISAILWNFNGPGRSISRREKITSTIRDWNTAENLTVVLAQECKNNMWEAWREEFQGQFDRNNKGETYCFRLNTPSDTRQHIEKRLYCCVLSSNLTPEDNLLVCSWHGPWNNCKKIQPRESRFIEMLDIVDKLKTANNCSSVLVGGDFNINSGKAKDILSGHQIQACLYDDYMRPTWRERLIDYIICWPKDRFLVWGCWKIDYIELFDHPIVRYDIILLPPDDSLETDKKMVWKGVGSGGCKGENMKGYWKGVGNGKCCINGSVKKKFTEMAREMQQGENLNVKWQDGEGRVAWVGDGTVTWECTKESEVTVYSADKIVWDQALVNHMNRLQLEDRTQ